MSTLNEREAVLRRALHAAADALEPGIDGLERIQSRLGRPRPVAVAWAEAAWTDLRLRAPVGVQTAFERIAGGIRLAWERFGPTAGMPGGRASRTLKWLRPLAALGVTVFIVAAGAYVAIDAQQAIFPSSSNSQNQSGGGSGPAGNSTGGSGTANTKSRSPVGGLVGPGGPSRSPSCKASRKPGSSVAPSASQSVGLIEPPTPTPTPSTSASGPGSPSPSTSDSSSPNPSSTATGAAGSSTTGPTAQASMSAGAVTNTTAVSHSPAAKASPSPCSPKSKKHPVQPNVNAHPAAVSFGRLNEAG
jgi:hypothetical protein